jgi:hypothetical protein
MPPATVTAAGLARGVAGLARVAASDPEVAEWAASRVAAARAVAAKAAVARAVVPRAVAGADGNPFKFNRGIIRKVQPSSLPDDAPFSAPLLLIDQKELDRIGDFI